MGNPIRKRVRSLRRAPDGSAFQNCEKCGEVVAVAIADMHECEAKKRRKTETVVTKSRINSNVTVIEENRFDLKAQPRSAFRFFMDGFVESSEALNQFDIDTEGFETWKNMSKQERLPYIVQAEKVNFAYERALVEEIEDMLWVNEEADSADVGRNMTTLPPLVNLKALRAYFGEQVKVSSPKTDYFCVHELFVKIVEL